MNGASRDWAEANKRHLLRALDEVRSLLQRHAGTGEDLAGPLQGEEEAGISPVPDPMEGEEDWEIPTPPALETVCRLFNLSAFERQVLLICAGIELDGSFASLCAAAQGDPRTAYSTFSLALAALPEAHWSALTPAAPLRYWRLIEVGSGASLATSPLSIDERVLHFLAGVSHLDRRLMGIVEQCFDLFPLVPSHAEITAGVVKVWAASAGSKIPAIQFCGSEASDTCNVAAAAAAEIGLQLYVLRPAALSQLSGDFNDFVRLWDREAALCGGALLIQCDDLDDQDPAHLQVMRLIEQSTGVVMISARRRMKGTVRMATFDVGKPSASEQMALWEESLGWEGDDRLGSVVSQFNLGSGMIREAVESALSGLGGEVDAEKLWQCCRLISRPRLDNLAQRIEPVAGWDDLVLPPQQQQILRQISLHVRLRSRVYEEWGFGAATSRGLGLTALFEGASGTGKTMAAEVLANGLKLDLYRIDLSQVVSKYIGETEKNLGQIFDAADCGGVILLFDEADALFGKRSEVKDSHDRYANIEVSYLLQRMEEYRGLAILTTNMKSALDTAFLRRIRFMVQFPFPDASYRAEIWKRVFPQQTPTHHLDMEKLARLSVAGGSIRNIALNAAFLAAGQLGSVQMSHLLQAARTEYAKLEKPLNSAEVNGWL